MATGAIFHKTQNRASADDGVRVNPEQRATRHFVNALGQITRGQAYFTILRIGREALAQMFRAFRAERDFGHVKWHGRCLVTAGLTDKAAEDRKPQENKEAHGIRNHGYEYRT
jgi:hypothetical protein